MSAFAETVRDLRKRRGLTQSDLAKLAGVSRHTVINVESDSLSDVKVSSLESIVRALGMQISITPRRLAPLEAISDDYRKAGEAIIREYGLDKEDAL